MRYSMWTVLLLLFLASPAVHAADEPKAKTTLYVRGVLINELRTAMSFTPRTRKSYSLIYLAWRSNAQKARWSELLTYTIWYLCSVGSEAVCYLAV